MAKKILITGATGFIGSNLVAQLRKEKQEVLTLPHEFLIDRTFIEKAFAKFKPTHIYHFAAYGNHATQRDNDTMFLSNVIATYNLLSSAIPHPYEAFINIGSSSEYGQKEEPMSEYDLPETETMYGATKVCGTYLARAFAKVFDKPIVTIRPFSVYGEGEADFRFIPTVIRSLVTNKKFTLEESPTHDWIYIKDFLRATQFIADNAEKLKGQVVNVGNGQSYSNKDVVEVIETLLDKKARYTKVVNQRVDNATLWQADSNKLSTLEFKNNYSLTDGLVEIVKFYKKKYESRR